MSKDKARYLEMHIPFSVMRAPVRHAATSRAEFCALAEVVGTFQLDSCVPFTFLVLS
jgi:hypothetical protein